MSAPQVPAPMDPALRERCIAADLAATYWALRVDAVIAELQAAGWGPSSQNLPSDQGTGGRSETP